MTILLITQAALTIGLHQLLQPPDAAVAEAKQNGYILTNAVPFLELRQGYSLSWSIPRGGAAPPMGRLCLIGPKVVCPVESLADLGGAMSINSAKSALAFVRLRTCMMTCQLFSRSNDVWCEIADKSKLPADFCLGQIDQTGFGSLFGNNGFYGVLSHPAFLKLGFSEPKALRIGSNYIVTRQIVRWHHSQPAVIAVVEQVSKKGEYAVLSTRIVKKDKLAEIHWFISTDFK